MHDAYICLDIKAINLLIQNHKRSLKMAHFVHSNCSMKQKMDYMRLWHLFWPHFVHSNCSRKHKMDNIRIFGIFYWPQHLLSTYNYCPPPLPPISHRTDNMLWSSSIEQGSSGDASAAQLTARRMAGGWRNFDS